LSREHFTTLGGFDSRIHDAYIEVDLCLRANTSELPVLYSEEARALLGKECFTVNEDLQDWQGRAAFFGKWVGKTPKNDDYLSFAKELLNN